MFQLYAQQNPRFENKIKKCESHKIMIEIAFSSLQRAIKIPGESNPLPLSKESLQNHAQLTVLSQVEAKCVVIKVNK